MAFSVRKGSLSLRWPFVRTPGRWWYLWAQKCLHFGGSTIQVGAVLYQIMVEDQHDLRQIPLRGYDLNPLQFRGRFRKPYSTPSEIHLLRTRQHAHHHILPATYRVSHTTFHRKSNLTLVIRSIVLEFDGDLRLHSSFQTAKV